MSECVSLLDLCHCGFQCYQLSNWSLLIHQCRYVSVPNCKLQRLGSHCVITYFWTRSNDILLFLLWHFHSKIPQAKKPICMTTRWKHLPQSTTITTPILLNCYASALRLLEHCSQEVHHGSLANNQHQQPETDQQLENSSMGRSKFLQILQDWALLAHNWTMYNCLAAPAGLRQSAPGWFPWIRLMLPSASCGLQHVARFHWQKCSLLLQVPIEQQHAMSPLTFNSPGCIRPIVRSDSL